jgi:hypothetical protein
MPSVEHDESREERIEEAVADWHYWVDRGNEL